MDRRACVLCGTTARPGRRICLECGGAVVDVADSPQEHAFTPAPAVSSPASYGEAGAWSPPPADGAARTVAAPSRPVRSRRPFVIAGVMLVLTVVVATAIAVVAWRDYRDQPLPAPTDLARYGKGEGRTYTTQWFIVRLPERYRTQSWTIPDGDHPIPLQLTSGVVGTTVLFAGSAPIPHDELADPAHMQQVLGAKLAGEMKVQVVGDSEVRPVSAQGGRGFDVVARTAAPPQLAYRVLVVGDHVVVLGAVAHDNVKGALAKIAESFQLV